MDPLDVEVDAPTDDDPHWTVFAPSLSYFAQGDTEHEAWKLFLEGLTTET